MFKQFFPNKAIEELTAKDILLWKRVVLLHRKASTWNNYVGQLHSIVQFGIEEGLVDIKENPFRRKKVKIGVKKKKVFTNEQLVKIFDYLYNDDLPNSLQPKWFIKASFNAFRYTGIRRGQLIQLTLEDIDLERRIIIIHPHKNKTNHYHEIPISKQLWEDFVTLLYKHQLRGTPKNQQLFNINRFSSTTYRMGRIMTDAQLSHIFKYLTKKLGFPVSPHRFRHTIATQLMRDPRNIYATKQLLGHASLSTTLGYVQDDPESLRQFLDNFDF